MKRNAALLLALLICTILALTGPDTPRPMPLGTGGYGMASTRLAPDDHLAEEERWADIGDTAYSQAFRSTFSYAQALVTVHYAKQGHTFFGVLEATGLKPNFAYQIKLRGNYQRSPKSHRALGYAGRWRLDQLGTNFTDAEYEDETYCSMAEAESYILFDWFVTDANGQARQPFCLQSSLHTLWNNAINYSFRSAETMKRIFDITQQPPVYDSPGAIRNIRIGAENEGAWRDRPEVGEARLPSLTYDCDLVLTEDSFHTSDGYWATVLKGPVEFTISRRQETR